MQSSLFTDNPFEQYSFPRPQYLGAKAGHLIWIDRYLPAEARTILDGFSGTQSVAFHAKKRGLRVLTNDILSANHQIGLSLVENTNARLDDGDISFLFSPSEKPGALMREQFSNLFFIESEAMVLDNFRANTRLLSSPYKQALALTIMNRAMQRKVIMGHFAHKQAISYAQDPQRVKRNPSIVRPLKSLFLELLPSYNSAIFDNGRENKSYRANILDLLPTLEHESVDVAYYDPPYTDSHADYQSFYHVLETFTEYWTDKDFVNGTHRYWPPRESGFDTRSEVLDSLEELMKKSAFIPYWLFSWNDRSYPSVADFAKIIGAYRDVAIERKPYANSRGGKGSVKGSNEILCVCRPRKVFSISQSPSYASHSSTSGMAASL